jgi:hypothetical protein
MSPQKIKTIVSEAIALDRQIVEMNRDLAALKSVLVAEAKSRNDNHSPTDGGGRSWTAEDHEGNIARVTFPAPTLKSSVNGEGKTIEKIRDAAGQWFSRLFQQAPKYVPTPEFREQAEALLGRAAGKLIKLMTSESAPRVSFEVKDIA